MRLSGQTSPLAIIGGFIATLYATEIYSQHRRWYSRMLLHLALELPNLLRKALELRSVALKLNLDLLRVELLAPRSGARR